MRLFEYRLGPHARTWVQKHLLEAFEFEGAALELGGAARCEEPDQQGALELECEAEAVLTA